MQHPLLALLAVLACAVAAAQATVQFRDCGSKGKDLKITVSGCTAADSACPFIVGENVTLTAEFTAGECLID